MKPMKFFESEERHFCEKKNISKKDYYDKSYYDRNSNSKQFEKKKLKIKFPGHFFWKIDGLHGDLKIIWKRLSPGRYPVQKICPRKKNGVYPREKFCLSKKRRFCDKKCTKIWNVQERRAIWRIRNQGRIFHFFYFVYFIYLFIFFYFVYFIFFFFLFLFFFIFF